MGSIPQDCHTILGWLPSTTIWNQTIFKKPILFISLGMPILAKVPKLHLSVRKWQYWSQTKRITYSIYGDDLLPNHLGNLFGKRADEFAKAAITTKKRQTAKGKAENTVLAGDPNYKEFAPEVSDWYINISSFEDIWKAIRREIGYYCGVTFYSIIIAIIINHYMDWMHHCQMLHLWIHI